MTSLNQANVKWKINQNLACIVKELQKEYPTGSPVTSESVVALHLCNIVESAFIHGLKDSGKTKDSLPKPQFWNIILKISHAETIKRVEELKFIKTRIGKCRAWLRLTLNDNAMTSYLAMLLSREHKTLRNQHYYNYALLLDGENGDIFLRHLSGIEALPFDLSFNSSVLNSWTRTPLEIAGLVPPSSSEPLYLSLQKTAGKGKVSSQRFISKHRGSAPAILSPNIYSKSLPSTSADEWSKKHGNDSSPKIQESIQEEREAEEKANTDDVLHERRLLRKRKKKLTNGLKGSLTSLLSMETTTSGSSSSARTTPRSGSFNGSPPVLVLQRRGSAVLERRASGPKLIHSDTADSKNADSLNNNKTSSSEDGAKQFESSSPPQDGSSSSPQGGSSSSPQGGSSCSPQGGSSSSPQDGSSCSPQGDTTDNGTSNSNLSSRKSSSEFDKIASDEIRNGDCHSTSPHPQNTDKPQNTENIETVMSNSSEFIDIYATPYQEVSQDSKTDPSSSFGNSLSRIGGWSEPDVTEVDGEESPNGHESTWTKNGISSLEEAHEPIKWSTPQNLTEKIKNNESEIEQFPDVYVRREGYLRKKGDALRQWKTRWFILSGKTLSYLKDKESEIVIETINLADVTLVSHRNSRSAAVFLIKMKDGTEHRCASSDKAAIAEWADDIKLMVSGAKLAPSKLELYKDIYAPNYVDEYEILSASDPGLKANTSWLASMVAQMGKMPHEHGLDTQCYQCADCASPIGIVHGPPRVCGFTGQYYCTHCHVNDETLIPVRLIRNWDFRKYKVAKRAKNFLEQVFSDPQLNVYEINPGIYKYIDELDRMLQLRQKLVHLKTYLQTCKNFDMDAVTKKLGPRPHFLEDIHQYSIQDLCGVHDRSLPNEISKIVSAGIKHVYDCTLCSAKGFLCEICKSDKVIFPFETDSTVRCFECKGVFHRHCKDEFCPRCERRRLRLTREIESQSQDTESD